MNPTQRELFDDLLERAIAELPEQVRRWLEEVPVMAEDRPSRRLLREMGMSEDEELYGLHSGVALTERSVERSGEAPDHILIFREPLWRLAGGSRRRLEREIRITLLHEIGHHFGLDEDDLEELGYG